MHPRYKPSNSFLTHPATHPSILPLKAWEQAALRHYTSAVGRVGDAHLAEWFTLALLLRSLENVITNTLSAETSASTCRDATPFLITAEIENRLYALFAE